MARGALARQRRRRDRREIDDAMRYGAGPRWSLMGTFLIYRIAGGEAGMRHFMAQFGPALQWPWTKLTDVPELDRRADRQDRRPIRRAGRRPRPRARAARDDCLVAVLQGCASQSSPRARRRVGATGSLRRPPAERAMDGRPTDAPLALPGGSSPGWVDYNGHVTRAATCRSSATPPTRCCAASASTPTTPRRGTYYTVETHICHIGEVHAGDRMAVTTQLLGADEKRVHLFHDLPRRRGTRLATGEQMLLHVDSHRRPPRSPPTPRMVSVVVEQDHAVRPRPGCPAQRGRAARSGAGPAPAPGPRLGPGLTRETRAAGRLAAGSRVRYNAGLDVLNKFIETKEMSDVSAERPSKQEPPFMKSRSRPEPAWTELGGFGREAADSGTPSPSTRRPAPRAHVGDEVAAAQVGPA